MTSRGGRAAGEMVEASRSDDGEEKRRVCGRKCTKIQNFSFSTFAPGGDFDFSIKIHHMKREKFTVALNELRKSLPLNVYI